MPNYNKNKGKTLEREVAKELTEVFGLNFERVWSSGAFTGGQNAFRLQKLTKEQALLSTGDILMPIELAHMVIECKFYKDFAWNSLFENNATLNGWIEQAQQAPSDKIWFLIFKINNCGKFVVWDAARFPSIQSWPNKFAYQGRYLITKYDGFFLKNKDLIINFAKSECTPSSTTTTPLSTSNP